MKVLTVIGARPQFVKAAVVSRAFAQYRPDVHEVIVHTGQHYDKNMSAVFFEELNINPPDFNLGVGGGGHGTNTGRMMEKLETLMLDLRPDWVLVYGDTDSTLAGALVAAKLHIRVAHVEAGLRSFNRMMPEEINRVLTDHVSTVLFSPTETARRNLRQEGIADERVKVVGDVMYDAALFYRDYAKQPTWFAALGITPGEYVLCTVHRAENTDHAERIKGILDGLERSGLPVILPLHPRTRKVLGQMGLGTPANVSVVEPASYLEMVWLELNCKIVATDSGGVQKEAYFHGKPCVTLRDETEWVELVESGWNILTGTNPQKIVDVLSCRKWETGRKTFYGDGQSARQVVMGLDPISVSRSRP